MAMALEGVRVIGQTRVMARPFCSMLPAAVGADVITVEPRRASTRWPELSIAPWFARRRSSVSTRPPS